MKKWKDEQVIKVVTGIRRCGKSTLLLQYQARLKADGISDPQYYLENEYDGDDSMEWFTQAAALGKIAALVF